jgi:hypothetical protein
MLAFMLAVAVAIAIVIMIIPVAVRMPAVAVFVPPPVFARPAGLTRLAQFFACFCCLPALPAVAINSRVQLLIGFYYAPLATLIIGANHRRTDESESRHQRHRCKYGPYPM